MPEPLHFATSNQNKLREAQLLLGRDIEALDVDLVEIQAATIEEIASRKLSEARALVDGPLFVEDVALGFDQLGGFPGPYVKWLLKSTGGAGVGRIASSLDDTRATAVCAIAFWDGAREHSFVGQSAGTILVQPRGSGGFGWDAWFLSVDCGLTFAEMDVDEKVRVSHRGEAYRRFRKFLESNQVSGLT